MRTSAPDQSLLRRIAVAAIGAGLWVASSAMAQVYPDHPITLVVPFPAAGVTDNVARLIGRKLSQNLGQPVVVENRPGAGGSLGTEQVARAQPDGYTLLVGTQGTHGSNLELYRNLRYDPVRDFTAVHSMMGSVNVLVVNPTRPYRTVKELIAYAKENPGKINYASAGNGTSTHLTAELFQSITGTKMTHVPYKGSAPALTDLIGGTVDIMFDFPNSAGVFIETAKLRALAVTHTVRLEALPNVPTMAEAGVAGAEAIGWGGIFAPAKTPPAIVKRLASELERVTSDAEVLQAIVQSGGIPLKISGDQFQSFVAVESVKWRKAAQRAGARAE